ncbi:cupin domain-containing protein [Aquamicrobium sp. LC103]|uniref:cupin domain-containing protein n=1 Tax=Aquamicrobium sp. LC103 TaxID=1120658 RepID=UPI00063EB1A2|nr:cupin domain-containing protein [Aquamicrobium sp. LC103]TKT75276.1 cupin domain-containing protein [Aquamicrobium sp. LC103]
MAKPGAAEIIAALGMEQHPEGGWYVETFRDGEGGARGHSTAIYFLLQKGERSHWHRVKDAAEVWHYHAGAPLVLSIWREEGAVEAVRLGIDLVAGERPQTVVPAGDWQAAETTGEWTLVGCTVAPGFRFESFELATPDWRPPSG